jgi:preprotein translocase subunit SecG
MNILIWILTAIHVIVAAVLVVLVLMQKSSDQGVGAAFGGQVTETMFGGSITPLVKMTIYCACILLATTLTLAVLHSRRSGQSQGSSLLNKMQQSAPAQPPAAPPMPAPAPAPAK